MAECELSDSILSDGASLVSLSELTVNLQCSTTVQKLLQHGPLLISQVERVDLRFKSTYHE